MEWTKHKVTSLDAVAGRLRASRSNTHARDSLVDNTHNARDISSVLEPQTRTALHGKCVRETGPTGSNVDWRTPERIGEDGLDVLTLLLEVGGLAHLCVRVHYAGSKS